VWETYPSRIDPETATIKGGMLKKVLSYVRQSESAFPGSASVSMGVSRIRNAYNKIDMQIDGIASI
jgi:hypothetical protein